MTYRSIFTVKDQQLFEEILVDFNWIKQNQKLNAIALQDAAKRLGIYPILEVSTKSDELLGQKLSAFNLKLDTPVGRLSVESVYQGSKVFEFGGPFIDIYSMNSKSAKTDLRLKKSGELIGFNYFGETWSNIPRHAFFNWLYLTAIYPYKGILKQLENYQSFSDIEYYSKLKGNSQARACALLKSLIKLNLLDAALVNQTSFIELVYPK